LNIPKPIGPVILAGFGSKRYAPKGDLFMITNTDVKEASTSPHGIAANEPFAELLRRIEAEIVEKPRFGVTLPEAQRLWGIDYATTIFLFRHLTERGIVSRTPRGKYVRG
jgi:hypothetical protein